MQAATRIVFLFSGILVLSAGLLAAPVTHSFSPVQIPQGSNASLWDINDQGQMVGIYTDNSGQGQGFLYSKGALTPIDAPGEIPPGGSWPLAVSSSGAIVGSYYDSARQFDSFLLANGIYTTLQPPPNSAPGIFAHDVNNHGQIVGEFGSAASSGIGEQGFLYAGGTMTVIDYPGAVNTSLNGINDAGEIVGAYYDQAGIEHGFLDSNNVFTTIDYPGQMTSLARINNVGEIAGYFPNESFLYVNGAFTTINYPDPETSFTQVTGLNDAGQLVGNFSVGNTPATQPFIATPVPEPGSFVWVLIGTAGLRRRRGRRMYAIRAVRGIAGPRMCF